MTWVQPLTPNHVHGELIFWRDLVRELYLAKYFNYGLQQILFTEVPDG